MGNRKGVWQTRTVRRKLWEERWSRDNLELIGGVPWEISEEKVGQGEMLKNDVTIMGKGLSRESSGGGTGGSAEEGVYQQGGCGDVRLHGEVPRVRVDTQGDGEAAAERAMQEKIGERACRDGKGAEGEKKGGRLRATEDGGG